MAGKPTTLDTIFCAAIELPSAADRAAYLAEACGGDDDLRDRVERLVAAHFQAGDFLEAPASELLATIEDAPAEEPGATIGAYQLLERIGEGGFGIVFMAQQTRPIRRVVALKIVKPGMDTHQVV